jgi:hypothetical protein
MKKTFTSSNNTEFTPHPDWPAQRDILRYEHLVGFSIRTKLKDGGTWIEIGPGTHAVALRPLESVSNIDLVVLSSDKVDLSGTNIRLEYGRIPDAVEFLQRYRGAADVVTDIFSSVTYLDDPAEALLCLSYLPNAKGRVGVFTELDKFGSVETWRCLESFFLQETGQVVTFEPFRIKGDAEPIWVDCLRVTVERRSRREVAELDELKGRLHECLGLPTVGRTIWKTKDGKATISEINYSRFPIPSELMRLATIKPA